MRQVRHRAIWSVILGRLASQAQGRRSTKVTLQLYANVIDIEELEAKRFFDFGRAWDRWQRGNQLAREFMLRAEEDRMWCIALHNRAFVNKGNTVAKPVG